MRRKYSYFNQGENNFYQYEFEQSQAIDQEHHDAKKPKKKNINQHQKKKKNIKKKNRKITIIFKNN